MATLNWEEEYEMASRLFRKQVAAAREQEARAEQAEQHLAEAAALLKRVGDTFGPTWTWQSSELVDEIHEFLHVVDPTYDV